MSDGRGSASRAAKGGLPPPPPLAMAASVRLRSTGLITQRILEVTMTGRHRPAFRALFALGLPVALSGCDLMGVACADQLALSVVVEVRDAADGMPAARGATGVSVHESGVLTDLYATGDLGLNGNWASELPRTTHDPRSQARIPAECRTCRRRRRPMPRGDRNRGGPHRPGPPGGARTPRFLRRGTGRRRLAPGGRGSARPQ